MPWPAVPPGPAAPPDAAFAVSLLPRTVRVDWPSLKRPPAKPLPPKRRPWLPSLPAAWLFVNVQLLTVKEGDKLLIPPPRPAPTSTTLLPPVLPLPPRARLLSKVLSLTVATAPNVFARPPPP